jgi:hypothetical protein
MRCSDVLSITKYSLDAGNTSNKNNNSSMTTIKCPGIQYPGMQQEQHFKENLSFL